MAADEGNKGPGQEEPPAGQAARQDADPLFAALGKSRYVLLIATGLVAALLLSGAVTAIVAIGIWASLAVAALFQAHTAEQSEQRAISRTRAAANRARQETANTDALLDALPDALIALNSDGRVVLMNRSARDMIGANTVGKYMRATLREPALLDAIDRVGAGGEPETVAIMRPVPVERHYQVLIAPAGSFLKEDKKSGKEPVLVLLHDVTDARRVEQMRVDFVANASHELKTPLASISGFIETLFGHAKDDPEAQQRFLGIMAEQSARMQRLIDDLLSLSRIELREHVPPSGAVDLAGLVKDVTDGVALIAERAGVEVSVMIPDGLPSLRGDWDELHQVVQNLVDNAIKYGGTGGRVEIEAVRPEGTETRIELRVRDFGPGIPRDQIPRLTERFYRVDIADSRERGGTGLGLAIVKHILNRHSAELAIHSVQGEGSTFAIRVPTI